MTLRVLTLSTLFPDATRPNFGVFVEQQTLALAARPGLEVTVFAPIGMPPFPLSLGRRHRGLRAVPEWETWRGLELERPRFVSLPYRKTWTPKAVAHAVGGHLNFAAFLGDPVPPFDVIDAEFFWPDGVAALHLSRWLGIPFSIKARGADIHLWGRRPDTARQVREAGCAADGLLAVSDALRSDMIALGIPADKIAVHYTGIDRSRFKPIDRAAAKAALGISGPLVLTVGALVPRKNQSLAIEAMTKLPHATLLIAGGGPDEAMLKQRIHALDLDDRVRLLGPVPHADLPRLMAAADVMLLMSRSEGLANVWVESLACGTPIVIGDIGGAREVLGSRDAGRLAAFDAAAAADAVRELLLDPPATEAVVRQVDRFSWETNAEQLESHLRRVAGKPSERH